MKRLRISLPPVGDAGKSFFARLGLTVLVMLAPLIMALFLTLPRGINLFSALPRWSDESWWFAQYAAVSRFGRPLGYFGYMGTHAGVGTFGPWGMFPVLPAGLLAGVFGWSLHAFVYYNFFFLAVSSLLFILLTKPSLRGLACLAVTNALALVAVCYCVICMNEIARYGMALVLTGLMVRLIDQPDCTKRRFILRCTLIPLLLIFASAFYLVLSVFIPIYLFIMLRRRKTPWRVLVTAAVSVAAVLLIRRMNGATACEYIVSASARTRSVSLPLSMRIQDFYYGVLANLTYIDPFYLLAHAGEDPELQVHLWLCLTAYTMIGMLTLRIFANAKDPEKSIQRRYDLLGLVLLLAFLGGHLVLYNTDGWTFVRGFYAALYCAMMLSAAAPKENAQPWRAGITMCALGAFTLITVFTTTFTTYDRFSTPEQDALWNTQRKALEQVLDLDWKAEDPWENTVVLCGTNNDIYFILPYGVGVNSAIEDVINVDAKYVIVGRNYSGEEERNARLLSLQENGHEIYFDTEGFTVLVNAAKFG